MAILVVCPGCRKRFSVSDQFAGKSGACPNCKGTIRVPAKGEEVKIHGPEEFGGSRGATGQLVLKPIARSETRFSVKAAATVAAVALAVIVVAYLGSRRGLFTGSTLLSSLGLLLISPPIVVAGYASLQHGDELEPYKGKSLYIRASICAAAYVVLWALWVFFARQLVADSEGLWVWLLVAPPFFVIGALAALAALDLDFGSGFFHYCFYLLVTVVIGRVAGLAWVWDVPRQETVTF